MISCFFCKKPNTYAVLTVIGAAIPLFFLGRWLMHNPFSLMEMFNQLSVNDVSMAVSMDALMSAITTTVLCLFDGWRNNMRWFWLPILATWTIGACAGLPLFLLLQSLNCTSSCNN